MESSPTTPVEGDSVTLTCSNTSTSLPADYIPLTEYRWWRGGEEIEPGDPDYQLTQPGNSRLSISSVSREDHGLEYRCQGREEGSTFTDEARVIMDVRCKMCCDITIVIVLLHHLSKYMNKYDSNDVK